MHNHDDIDEEALIIPSGPVIPRPGYKSPPVAHRFKTGKSGNPRGRPKGSKGNRKIAEKVLLEEHDIREGDRIVRRKTIELLILALRNKAFEGNTRAFKDIEKLYAKFDLEPAATPPGVLVVPGRLTTASWRELFEPKTDPTQDEE